MKSIRNTMERLMRGRTFVRALPARYAPTRLHVSPDSQLKYLLPGERAFDAELLRIVDLWIRADSIVWDVGANIGVFGFAAASIARSGKVIAIEPDCWLAQLMIQSKMIPENSQLQIEVLCAAISKSVGVETLQIAMRGRASNSLAVAGGRTNQGGSRCEFSTVTLTLDWLLEYFAPPTFVKIDVEGAEQLVLEGASRLLSEVHPIIYVEVGKAQASSVTETLQSFGYQLYDPLDPDLVRPIERCGFNTIAVHPASLGKHQQRGRKASA
jgi:FkbM family methyltransferase